MPIIALALLLLTSCFNQDQSKPKIRFIDSKGNPKQLEIKALELNSRSMNQQKIAFESKAVNDNMPVAQKNQTAVPDFQAPTPANSEPASNSENFLTPPFESKNGVVANQESLEQASNKPLKYSITAGPENESTSAQSSSSLASQNSDEIVPDQFTNQTMTLPSEQSLQADPKSNQQLIIAAPKKEAAEPKEILFQLDNLSKSQEPVANKFEKQRTNKAPTNQEIAIRKTKSGPSKYYVQVGSFLQKEKAKNLVEKMKEFSQGKVETVESEDRVVYRALLGPFSSKAEARTTVSEIKENGQEAILVKSK